MSHGPRRRDGWMVVEVYQTMNPSFVSLSACNPPGEMPGESQVRARAEFPGLVSESPLNYWRPGDAVPTSGHRILLCVATYSQTDLYFLDVLTSSVPHTLLSKDRLDVFDFLDLETHADVAKYFPGLDTIVSTPHAGLWEDGVLRKMALGGLSYKLITEHYGFDFDSSKSQDYKFLRKRGLIP